jgi:peptide/nickel transport system substrate-binding protein
MRRLVAVLGTAMLVAVSCSSSGTPGGGASPSAAATEKPQQGGRVVEATISDIATMQPVLVNDTASGRITGLIYDPILQVDYKTGEPKPRLASATVSSDSLKYTFEMNAKAVWSDGKPVIADDWLTGLKAVGKSKKTVRKSTFKDVVGFTDYSDGKAASIGGVAIDPANNKKWTVTMAKVSCSAIIDLIGYTLPTQVFGKYVTDASKDEIDTAPENTAPTVVSGPFKFTEWRKGDQVILDKNPTYWQGAPNIDQYVYKVVANQTAITNGLKTGEITWGTIQAKDLADVQTVATVKIDKFQNLG